jgi:DtxR family Mn-dependent transcriptional regulator
MRLTDREEDYLRALYELIEDKGYARVKDISKILEVTPASVVGMMRKLSKKELVIYKKHEPLKLSAEGLVHAKAVSNRHETFKQFLKIINVPDKIAAKDAHILEHHLDVKTINQFKKFVDLINNAEKHNKLLSQYKEMLLDIMQQKE